MRPIMRGAKHLTTFEGKYGKSPQEFHAQYAFPTNAKCAACSSKPSVRAIVLCPLDEAEKRGFVPPGSARAPLAFPAIQPVLVPLRHSPTSIEYFVRISIAYSCARCRRAMEKTLAKAPSYCVVEINEGPNPRHRVSVGAN